jgi:methylenetetrahydrofolate dehydrogenase (NADP+)/methenyltetrahydrofolate cyclohydrolase
MPAQVIDGKQIAQTIREEIKVKTHEFINRTGIQPGLATILVGQDPASQVYVRNKHRGCAEVGFYSEKHELPETTTAEELVALVQKLNNDPKIHGILVQLPLPKHIPESVAIDAIDPQKDVDGIHPNSIGNLVLGKPAFVACTPAGVMRLIDTTGIELKGKHAVVVGRSNIVGKPLSLLLLARHATVTICHSRTQDLGAVTRTADVLCVAVGKAKLIKGDMVKPGAVVIDVGTNRNEEGKLVGDVDFESVLPVAKAITPVPKGVGPMTITMLLWNTLESAEKFAAKK